MAPGPGIGSGSGTFLFDACGIFGVLVVLLVAVALASSMRRRDGFEVDINDLTSVGERSVCLLAAKQVDDTCGGKFNVQDKLFFADPTLDPNLQGTYYMSKGMTLAQDGHSGSASLDLTVADENGSFVVLGRGGGVAHKLDASGRAAYAGGLNVGSSLSGGPGVVNIWNKGGGQSYFGGAGMVKNNVVGDTLADGRLEVDETLVVTGSVYAANQLCVGGQCFDRPAMVTCVDIADNYSSRMKHIADQMAAQDVRIKKLDQRLSGEGGLNSKYTEASGKFNAYKGQVNAELVSQGSLITAGFGTFQTDLDAEKTALSESSQLHLPPSASSMGSVTIGNGAVTRNLPDYFTDATGHGALKFALATNPQGNAAVSGTTLTVQGSSAGAAYTVWVKATNTVGSSYSSLQVTENLK